MRRQNPDVRAIVALLFLSVIWGYNWVVMKLALPFISAIQFCAIRTFFGSLVLFVVLLALKKSPKPTHIRQTLLLGLLQTTGFVGLIIWALVEGGAGKVAVLAYTMPFWVVALAWPLLGEKIRGIQWIGLLLSVAGLFSIIEPWNFHGNLFSDVLAVLAGLVWALAVILAKKLHQRAPRIDLLSFTAWQMLFGSLPLVALTLVIPSKPVEWSDTLIIATLFNVILANGLGWWLWLYALRRLPAGMASMNSLLVPVIAVLSAWTQLSETPSAAEAVGMLMIAAALMIIGVHGIRRKEVAEPATGQD